MEFSMGFSLGHCNATNIVMCICVMITLVVFFVSISSVLKIALSKRKGKAVEKITTKEKSDTDGRKEEE